MEISGLLRRRQNEGQPTQELTIRGERLDRSSVRSWRERILKGEGATTAVLEAGIRRQPPRGAATTDAATGERGIRKSPAALKIFLSYSHSNEQMKESLHSHLAPMEDDQLIEIWHDRAIEAGGDWEGAINSEISQADVIPLLVTGSFHRSRYCRKELLQAISLRDQGKALPIPIILRHCDWTSVINKGAYKAQALPRDDRPVAGSNWRNQDAAYSEFARELRGRFQVMRAEQ